jgi:hypothetical protein
MASSPVQLVAEGAVLVNTEAWLATPMELDQQHAEVQLQASIGFEAFSEIPEYEGMSKPVSSEPAEPGIAIRQPEVIPPSRPVLSPKERAQLAQGRLSAPTSLQPVIIIEMWVGIGTLTAAFDLRGYPPSAFCEMDQLLTDVFLARHTNIQFAGKFEDMAWKKWMFPANALIVVVGGPSCVSLSSAGRQQFGQDPSSLHIRHTIEVAAFFQASFAMIENVPELLELDHLHGLRSDVHNLALSHDLIPVGHVVFRDSEAGGFTQRRRFFDFFESKDVADALPAWQPPECQAHPRRLDEILLHEEDLDFDTLLQMRLGCSGACSFEALGPSLLTGYVGRLPDPYKALRVGTLHWKPDLPVPGALVSLQGQHSSPNRWCVLQSLNQGQLLMVRLNDPRRPVTRTIKLVEVNSVLQVHLPVYSTQRPGVTLRRYGDPPIGNSFAVLRVSSTGPFVSTLAPIEAWRAHGLCDDLADLVLLLGGTRDDLSLIAGNCITMASAQLVVGHIVDRIELFNQTSCSAVDAAAALRLEHALSWRPAHGWLDPEAPLAPGSLNVVLMPVTFDSTPWFLLGSQGYIGKCIHASDRGHKAAQAMAKSLALDTFRRPLEVMLAARFQHADQTMTLVFVVPVPTFEIHRGLWSQLHDVPQICQVWCSMSAIALLSVMPPDAMSPLFPTPDEKTTALAMWWKAQSDVFTSVNASGAGAHARPVLANKAPTGCSSDWLAAKRGLIATSNDLLRSCLVSEAQHFGGSIRKSLMGWADSVLDVPWSEIPAQLLSELDQFHDPALLILPFPEPCPVAVTDHLPLSVQPPVLPGFKPTLLTDLLTAEALELIRLWVAQQLMFLKDILENGAAAVRTSNKPLALGQDCFVPAARGVVWDLRRLDQGIIEPVDFQAPISSHLNLDLFRAELEGYPDQELLGFLLEGVRYKTDLELQVVLLPHLISLKEGYGSLLSEVAKYEAEGWYGLFNHPPFLPFRCVPKGSVPRKLELDRPRPITDAGAPRSELDDTEGRPVVSTNHSALGRPPQQLAGKVPEQPGVSKWPHENKPTVGGALIALVILNAVAWLLHEPVLVASDDFMNFFNQLRTAPEEWWKNCMMIMYQLLAKYVTEYIMTFGISPASNIAQRFAEAILFIFRKRFAEADAPFLEEDMRRCPALRAWYKARLDLGDPLMQAQLMHTCVYTDDPIFVVVGAARMARALRVWTVLTDEFHLLMAIAIKRQAGSHVFWVGAGLLAPLALAWVPLPKAVSALGKLDKVLHRPKPTINIDEYHSLIGLLEHLVFLNGMKRNIMYGLWHPFQQGYMPEPNVVIVATPLMLQQAHRWTKLLQTSAAVSGLRLIRKTTTDSTASTAPTFSASSDAFQDRFAAGVGGWCHGLVWNFMLPRDLVKLNIHITVLELIGSIVTVATLATEATSLFDTGVTLSLHARSDASATVSTLANDKARSEMMQVVHDAALGDPAFNKHLPLLSFSHIYGIANEFADAASRGDLVRLVALAAQLRITPRWVKPAPLLFKLLDLVASAYRSKRDLALENVVALVVANAPTSASFIKLSAPAGMLLNFGFTPAVAAVAPISKQLHRTSHVKPQKVSSLSTAKTVAKLTTANRPLVMHTPILCESSQGSRMARKLKGFTAMNPMSVEEKSELFELSMQGRNQGTVANENGHWRKYWLPFCLLRGIHPLRDDRAANSGADAAGYQEEVEILCDFLIHISTIMKPKGNRPAALPASQAGVLRGIRRVHSKQLPPIEMVPFRAVLPVLKGLTTRYKKVHNYRNLLPQRKEPWRLAALVRMFKLRLRKDLRLGGFGWEDLLLMTCYFALLETLAQTGMRRSETAVRHKLKFDPSSHLTRANLQWSLGGTLYADPSPALLRKATEADYALLIPPCSKTDEYGVIWGDKPIPLPFRFKAPYCAALRLREIELLHPLHGGDRLLSPLFLMAEGIPFTYHYLNKMMADVKEIVLEESVDSSLFTYHSFRITLATQLGAVTSMKITDNDIQAMCRWQSEQSLKIYKRMQPGRYIQMLDAAMTSNITSYLTSNLPTLDSHSSFEGIIDDASSELVLD